MLQRLVVLHLILYIRIKGGGLKGYMNSTGGRLGAFRVVGAAKQRNLWDWIENKRNRHILLLRVCIG